MLKMLFILFILALALGSGFKVFMVLSPHQRKKFLKWFLYCGTMLVVAASLLTLVVWLF